MAISFVATIIASPTIIFSAQNTHTSVNTTIEINSLASGKTLMQQAVALSRFERSLLAGENKSEMRSINEIMQDIGNLEQDYLDDLQGRRSSYGLFAVGEFDDDIQNSETRYLAGLEWRIFNDGYYEAVRRDTQKILQTKLEFYQLRRDMIDRQLEEDLYNLFTIENLINLNHYQEKASALTKLLNKRLIQLENGYTTEIDVLDIKRQLKNARNSLIFYKQSVKTGLTDDQINILNKLEAVQLKPTATLVELARTNSFGLKIQDNFIERSDFFPAWSDNVAVNVNAEYKHEFYEQDRTIMGIEVEVPLTFDTKRQSLIDTQKRIYRYQKEAINHRLQQRVEKLSSFYLYQQHRLVAQQESLELLLIKIRNNKTKERHIIQQLDDDPARNLDLISINMIDIRYEALVTRIKIYEIILKLMPLTQAETITALFEFD